MNSIVCTLFESHYHLGVVALANSLYEHGYRGAVYVGYRGALPEWTATSMKPCKLMWPGATTLEVEEDFVLHFLPLTTDYHFTNYKPDFMLDLLRVVGTDTDYIFYFDPDIVVTAPWSSFKEWADCGVAVCEDVNSPVAKYHPRRVAWRHYFGSRNLQLTFKESIYANAGFIGLRINNASFLTCWKRVQDLMAPEIGGLERSSLTGPALHEDAQSIFAPFSKTDQDALNATVEAWDGPVSFLGKEGMSFIHGAPMMSHALGQPKPWRWNPLLQLCDGYPPRQVDRDYWHSVNGPITLHAPGFVRRRKLSLKVASFIGRFYRRGI